MRREAVVAGFKALLFSWTTEDNHEKNSGKISNVPQIMRVYLTILPVTEEA
jgi:hypothetical protein